MASGNTLDVLDAARGEPLGGNVSFDTRNSIVVLAFPDTTTSFIAFKSYLPSHYAGGGLSVDLYWAAASATSGDVKWGVNVERGNANNHDFDANNFGPDCAATGTANATSGKKIKTTVAVTAGTNMDNAVAGDPIRFIVQRMGDDAGDTMAGNAQLFEAVVSEA